MMQAFKFQFYDSTIKREAQIAGEGVALRFQFYDSTIKRLSAGAIIRGILNFNSTIVRLKDNMKQFWQNFYKNFNSTIVRLKVRKCFYTYSSDYLFQFYDSTIKR